MHMTERMVPGYKASEWKSQAKTHQGGRQLVCQFAANIQARCLCSHSCPAAAAAAAASVVVCNGRVYLGRERAIIVNWGPMSLLYLHVYHSNVVFAACTPVLTQARYLLLNTLGDQRNKSKSSQANPK